MKIEPCMWRLTNELGQVSYMAIAEDQQLSLGTEMNYELHEVNLDKLEEFKLLLRQITE